MNVIPIARDIVAAVESGERSVIVRRGRYATVVDLPDDAAAARAILAEAVRLAPGGLHAIVLPRSSDLPHSLGIPACLRIIRPGVLSNEDRLGQPLPPPQLGGPAPALEPVSEPACSDGVHWFAFEPCLGDPMCAAVRVLPEDVLVVGDDLRPDLPPVVRTGCVHETVVRLREWLDRMPRFLVPASGMVLTGADVKETLARAAQYLQDLYDRTRAGMVVSHFPLERLILTIPCHALWNGASASRVLIDRHRANVRSVAHEIWARMQAEADGVTIVA